MRLCLIFVTRHETGTFWQTNAVIIRLISDYDAVLPAYDNAATVIVVSHVAFDDRIGRPQFKAAHPCPVLIKAAPATTGVSYYFHRVAIADLSCEYA